jgi:hypothetical protein
MRQGDAPARLVPGIAASAELFDVLGARPFLGRGSAPARTRPARAVAVLSYGLWKELGGSPPVLGTASCSTARRRPVVGVMPRGFWFPDPGVRLWRAQADRARAE